MSNKRPLTHIPAELEYLPQEHLIHLLRIVVAERDELYQTLQREQAKSAAAVAAAAVAAPTFQNDAYGFPYPAAADTAQPPSGVPSSFKVDAVKKRIAKKSFTLVKKTAHNKAKKPFTELNEAVPNAACALSLFEDFDPKSDTTRLIKWDLTGDEVVEWLGGLNKYIHPVKFDGRVIAFGGAKPFVYAWAAYESLSAKYDKKGGTLSLKFRTKMVGSGRPQEGSDSPPSFA
jgi:hypothetical protein